MIAIEDVFNVQKNIISSKINCSITIDDRDYNEKILIETSDKFIIPGILQFYCPDLDDYCQIVLNYSVDLMKTKNINNIDKHIFIINYEPGDTVLTKDYYPVETNMGLLIQLTEGRIKYINDPKILLTMFHDIIPSVDLVHLELIISNMFRVPGNEDERCRIKGNYKNAVILGAAKQPFQDSWHSALSFQYIEKAIQKGLIDKKSTEQNPIEKVLSEDFSKL